MPVEETEITKARRAKWRELEGNGMSRSKIAEMNGVSRQYVSAILGPMERDGDRIEVHIYTVPELLAEAVKIAESYGLFHHGGKNARKGSVGRLIDKIGKGELVVVPPEQVCTNENHAPPRGEADKT